MPTTPATVPTLPTAPDPNDRSTFNIRAYPWSAALDPWTVAVNSAAAATNTNATEAEADAVTANTKAGEAAASASTASTAATTATTAATTATTAATTATTKAGEADASATAAAASAVSATSAATTAASTAAASVSATLTAAVAASATTATNAATSATASATAAANSASSAAAIVLGVSTGHPTLRPSLNLDFANSKTVDPRITFTRASTATRTNAKGLIESVASGAPRIDYDPVTGVCKGLLIEEARTNLLTYSEDFGNADWAKTFSTVTANSVTAPDGTLSADKLVVNDTISSTSAYLAQGVTKSATATTYTLSCYAKAAEKGGLRVYIRDSDNSANFANAAFNLITGAVSVAASTGGTFTAASATPATDCGNGWYRCTLKFTSGTETSLVIRPIVLNSDGTAFTGNGTDGIYIWGAQLEAGAFPTSYIPTTTATATRAAELASMTGTNFSTWYRQDEGSLYGEVSRTWTGVGDRVFAAISSGTANNTFDLYTTASNNFTIYMASGGVVQASPAVANAFTATTPMRATGAYGVNSVRGAAGGVLSSPDALALVPVCNQLSIGSRAGSLTWNGCIRKLSYWPKRIADAELQTITAA